MERVAINKARVVYYGLFASLFSFCMTREHFEIIEKSVDLLSENPIDEQTAKALPGITKRLQEGGYPALKEESDQVFYNPTTTFVPMTASYYYEQRDDGSKRREMINYLLESKFRRNASEYKEHEDHIEFILLLIQQLIREELKGDLSCQVLSVKIFARILNEMIDAFSDNLFNHEKSILYKNAALVLRSFVAFERLFLNITEPAEGTANSLARPNIKKDQSRSAGF